MDVLYVLFCKPSQTAVNQKPIFYRALSIGGSGSTEMDTKRVQEVGLARPITPEVSITEPENLPPPPSKPVSICKYYFLLDYIEKCTTVTMVMKKVTICCKN